IPIIRKLSDNPKIELLINSVFTPTTIQYFSKSIELLLNLKVPSIRCSLSFLKPWNENSISRYKDELIKTRELLLPIYRKTGTMPIVNFSQKPQIAYCPAGSDRLSISTNGEIWGCPLFSDYFERIGESSDRSKYCFGTVEEFLKNDGKKYSQVLQNYYELRMDHYATPEMDCFLCHEIEYCSVCPISSSLSGCPLNKIPSFVCKIQKIKINEILRFFK
ncbi:MAG: radical SAM protein, partial [Promethearchaeota archaeon]